MNFGIILPSYLPSATPDAMRQAAVLAEQLGFDSAWTTDHVMVGRHEQVPYHYIFEAVTTLGWLAALTTRLKLGVSVVVLPQRQPVLLAKQMATLDQLSGGRMILGVGGGWCEEEFQYLGADFHRRGRVYDEAIQALRVLWTEPEKPFSGQFINFENHSFAPGPVQAGGIPIWVGGNSPAALKRAARYADGWHGNLAPVEEFKQRVDQLRSYAAGRELLISARASVAEERREVTGSRARMFTLGGDAQTIVDDIHRFEDVGCSHMAVGFWDGDPARFLQRMERFAGEVVPKV